MATGRPFDVVLTTVCSRLAAIQATLSELESIIPSNTPLQVQCEACQAAVHRHIQILKSGSETQIPMMLESIRSTINDVQVISMALESRRLMTESMSYKSRLMVQSLRKSTLELQYLADRKVN
jgi:hypothetical protein